MKVGAGRFAGRPFVANDLPLDHGLPLPDHDLALVSVERLCAVRMIDHDITPVSAVPAALFCHNNLAARCRAYRGAVRCGQVDRVISVEALGLDVAAGNERTNEVPTSCRGIRHDRGLAQRFRRIARDTRAALRGLGRFRRCRHLTARYRHGRTNGQAAVHRKAVVGDDLVLVAAIRLCETRQRIALHDRMLYAGYRQDEQGLSGVYILVRGKFVRPHDRVHRHIEHRRDLREGITILDHVERDLV